MTGLCDADARDLARLIRAREVSAREVMQAHLARIDRINPSINAIVELLPHDRCLQLADDVDRSLASGQVVGPLGGLPVAFKDTEPAVGFTHSQGSPIFRHVRPTADSTVVRRIREAGAIPIGKTNVPEFAMGSHTYNRVYGATRNPYDPSKSAGGSTGGGAAAVTTGMLPLADGSDLGGSLRNPASFNNIVGYRPSVGLVPLGPGALPYGFGVKGPVGRTVEDVALLLGVMAGAEDGDPSVFLSEPGAPVLMEPCDPRGIRVAWTVDLGGLPVAADVRAALEPVRRVLEDLGCTVEDASPDLTGADEAFLTIRRWRSWHTLGPLLERYRGELKPEAVEEIELGARVTGAEVARAMSEHAALMERMAQFQRRYDFIACTVSQVSPFDIHVTWPREIDGVAMDRYVSWMKSAYLISATWCPAIAMPAAFTAAGLPVGLQIVGRFRRDAALLSFAREFERAHPVGRMRPPLANLE
jgi:amidase